MATKYTAVTFFRVGGGGWKMIHGYRYQVECVLCVCVCVCEILHLCDKLIGEESSDQVSDIATKPGHEEPE